MPPLRCDHCGTRHREGWRCGCGGPLSVDPPGRFDGPARARRNDIWRYRDLFGAGSIEPVTLGEGFTPIVEARIGGIPLSLKLESLMPTGSFKDRGASVVISRMAAAGVTRAVEDSSGNAGLSLAAYASHAGIRMEILVPDDAPAPKCRAITICGGRLVRVPGGREAAAREALRIAESGVPFASHCWDPYFIQGTMSFAFELRDQTGGDIPSTIIMPVGNGTLLIGAFRGFRMLRDQGLIPRLPRLIGVQAAACAPLCDAGTGSTASGSTIADGIRVAHPIRERAIRDAVAQSGGCFIAVSDEAIATARRLLGEAGVDAEPTAAAGAAAAILETLPPVPDGLPPGPPLVVVTGSGLKVSG